VSNRRKPDDRRTRAAQLRRDRERAEARRTRLVTGSVVAAVVVIVVAAAVAIAYNQQGGGETPDGDITSEYGFVYSAETIDSDQQSDELTPVEMVVYEDFICPACGQFEQQVSGYLEEQVSIGAISVEYRPIAFLDRMSTTDYSTRAANAAACVFDSSGAETFHEFHDLLFANQPPERGAGLTDDELIALAEEAGADDVDGCITEREFDGWVEEANDSASQNNVVSTPTVYVAGQEVDGANGGVPTLQDVLNAVLAASQEPTGSPSS
jgi:protein-disulfide isomerase